MLDKSIIDQLTGIFSNIEGEYVFAASLDPDTDKGREMRGFLKDFCSVSMHFSYVENVLEAPPSFEIIRNSEPLGVSFTGVPGGHEFNTLILAVYNVDGKGQNLPDEHTIRRIRSINADVRISTFVSLSCTNCPAVAQAMNLIAIYNRRITNNVIDGNVVPEMMKDLGIQAVPAVYADGSIMSVGRATLSDLLGKLEEIAGTEREQEGAKTVHEVPLLILGGGPAGIAAAIYSARKNIDVAVISGETGGSVNLTNDIENLIVAGKTTGPRLAAALKENALACGVKIFEGRKAVKASFDADSYEIECEGGEIFRSPRLIIASGSKPRRMNVPGEEEYVGRGIAFCPHCDGPMFKGKDVAVIGGGNAGIEAALDLSGICRSVAVFEFLDTLKADNVLIDKARETGNISIHTGCAVEAVEGDGKRLTALRVRRRSDGEVKEYPFSGVFVQIGSTPDSGLFKDQLDINKRGEIVVDRHCRTSRARVYAAGDVTDDPYRQVATAVGSGATAALASFEDSLRE